jgi:ABC-type antimicrobial peptide transport system permease subunit
MKIGDIFSESFRAISSNKARSGLTVLGIVIGIASVIALLAIGQGSTNSITSSIESTGANLLTVTPGFSRTAGPVFGGRGSARTLTVDDATAIAQEVGQIAAIAPQVDGRYQVVASSANSNTQVIGTVSTYTGVHKITIAEGSFISDVQQENASRVAVLGATTATDLFGDPANGGTDPVGQTIRIKSGSFTVIGVAASKGGTGFANPDDVIYVPLKTSQRFLAGQTTYLSSIGIEAATQKSMTQVQTDITDLLLTRHKISDSSTADFSVINQADLASTLSSTTRTLTLLLAAVAGISLIVGGIGIMNMMLTTVTERTREIGLRKAIGAKRRDVSVQFLVESVLLTFSSGVLGIILGWLVAVALTKFAGYQSQVTLFSVVLAFGVSALIGIVFGYYPARRAAGLNPIEALRYE